MTGVEGYVKAMAETNEAIISTGARARLGEVRRALLKLHKALLDDERIQYERVRGRVESSGALLQLILHDEWFAYLRPLSALVAQIDELLDADEATEREAEALVAQASMMLKPDESSSYGLGGEVSRRIATRAGSRFGARGSCPSA